MNRLSSSGSRAMHLISAAIFAMVLCLSTAFAIANPNDGKQIYVDQCADCHGDRGQGVDGAYENRLTGVLTLYELEDYIAQTMPEGDHESCVGTDAKLVAKYVYDQFYSIEAQNRLSPPKYVFSRLTNEQYKNSVADLLSAALNRRESAPTEYGLKGTYYNSRSMRNNQKVNERTDPQIDFDFGEGSPDKVKGKEFSIRWTGSLIAAESGEYTIIVESANSVRLRLNSSRKPLIDANVVSGDRAEYRGQINLLEGRLYNLSIDVSRFKEKNGFVRISWIRPNGHQEVIPSTHLCTQRSGPLIVLSTDFPPDDESYGYPRGISISKEWTSAIAKAAIEAGQMVVRYFDAFVKPNANAAARREAAKAFCADLAAKAFRQPLSPELKRVYVDTHFDNTKLGVREATKRAVVLILKSPRFLYLDVGQVEPAPASTLARVYWDSVPNRSLLQAQSKQQLVDKSSANWILNRMLDDRRTQVKVEQFFRHYFKLDELKELEKDSELYTEFDSELVEDLKRSFLIQITELVWSKDFQLQHLFSTKSIYVNQRLADFYGLKLPPGETPDKAKKGNAAKKDKESNAKKTDQQRGPNPSSVGEFVKIESPSQAGMLTHPLLMSGFAYAKSSSPIHRGVFLAKNILGRRLNPPPDAFPPFDGEIAKTWTTREKVAFQTKPVSCQRCHGLINNLGFAFEAYDAVGKIRARDNQKPVETRGQFRTDDGKWVEYKSAAELANYLGKSPAVREHFVTELFQFMVKQPVAAYGPSAVKRLSAITQQNLSLRTLLIEIGKIAAFEKPIQ